MVEAYKLYVQLKNPETKKHKSSDSVYVMLKNGFKIMYVFIEV